MLNISQEPPDPWEHHFSVYSWLAPVVSQRRPTASLQSGGWAVVILAMVKMPFPSISEATTPWHAAVPGRLVQRRWRGSVLRGLSFKIMYIIGLRDVRKTKKHSIALETLETCRELIMVQLLGDFRAFHKVWPGKEGCGQEPTPNTSSHPTAPSEVAQSCLTLCGPKDYSLPESSIHGISRQEYWSGLPFPSPGDLPNPGIEPRSPAVQADSLPSAPPGKPRTTAPSHC